MTSFPVGLRFMAFSALAFSLMAVFVKLGGNHLSTQELIAFRSLFIIAATLPILIGRRVPVFGRNYGRLLLRGIFGFIAMSGYFWTLTRLPVADAIVIQYTSPIFTTIFAALFLKEEASPRLWLVILCCLLGVAAVAKPGFGGDPLVALVGLGAATFSGAAYTVVRSLRGKENAYTIIFYFPLVSLPFSAAAAWPEWLWPTGWEWGIVLGVSLCSYLGQVFLTKGLERESAGRAVTVNYLSIVFGSLLGWLVFGKPPDLLSISGIVLIMGSITLLNRRSVVEKPSVPPEDVIADE